MKIIKKFNEKKDYSPFGMQLPSKRLWAEVHYQFVSFGELNIFSRKD